LYKKLKVVLWESLIKKSKPLLLRTESQTVNAEHEAALHVYIYRCRHNINTKLRCSKSFEAKLSQI